MHGSGGAIVGQSPEKGWSIAFRARTVANWEERFMP